mmetsp:Transcript_31816/g.74882  ORF Transcript_31816/g.74882 Transcript_31816/m.74882 type:complete len:124 (+) Transcript_31816:1703-2074(+)
MFFRALTSEHTNGRHSAQEVKPYPQKYQQLVPQIRQHFRPQNQALVATIRMFKLEKRRRTAHGQAEEALKRGKGSARGSMVPKRYTTFVRKLVGKRQVWECANICTSRSKGAGERQRRKINRL